MKMASEQLREYLKPLIQRKPTLETRLELEDTIIINAALIVQGISGTTLTRIFLGGTLRTVSLGETVCVTAGKMENTIILEVHAKRENLDPSVQDQDFLYGTISKGVYNVRTTEKLLFGLTARDRQVKVLGGTFNLDLGELLVFLELKRMDTE